ncbi:MAG: hypothetical protein P4L82_17260 [Ancalomicrobiaceae bacterium]|nr:hypothetical protein [Ancalomicrobiaceae bacterium]
MSLAVRLASAAFVAVVASALISGYVSMRAADAVVASSFQTSRDYSLASLGDLMDSLSEIGLDLRHMTTMQAVIERAKASDPSVLAIDIFGRNGRIVYSTDPNSVGLAVPDRWKEQMDGASKPTSAGRELFSFAERDELAIGTVVLDLIGQPLGGIVVTAELQTGMRQAIDLRILFGSAGAGIAAAVVAAALAARLARRLSQDVRRATDVIAMRPADAPSAGGLTKLAMSADRAWDGAEAAFGATLVELEHLDEAG